jgi:transglutaminase-like putative cysteine protease
VNTDAEGAQYTPTHLPDLPIYNLRQPVTQTIISLVPEGNMLFAASLPAGASLAIDADITLLPPAAEDAATQGRQLVDISRMISQEPLQEGTAYTTLSQITTADKESLRKAGNEYPAYIRERYLQVPDTLPERVRQLADEITASYNDAYDKATALEAHLRKIQYNDQIAPPPSGADGVDYFLFDIQAGYCDYYASAMAVMARSVDIPARLVSGYAQGEWAEEIQAYRVRELDAHTWVEVYFPRYGWIEFEPTASQRAIERPERHEESQAEQNPTSPSDQPTRTPPEDDPLLRAEQNPAPPTTSPIQRISPWIGAVLAGVILVVAVIAGSQARRRVLSRDPRLSAWLYDRLLRWAERVGIGLSPMRTPYEEASIIATVIPEGQPHILDITSAYVRDRYSTHALPSTEQARSLQSWEQLRSTFWKRWLRWHLGLPHKQRKGKREG